ncbi:hypothetical protein [Nocardia sp. NPDC059228]
MSRRGHAFRELGTRSIHDSLDRALGKVLQSELRAYLETAARRRAQD